MKARSFLFWSVLAILGAPVWAQSGGTVLLDISLQSKANELNFSYNTSPLIPMGELSRFPIKSDDTGGRNLELRVLATTPKNAPGKNLVDVQIELHSLEGAGQSKILGQAKMLTRLNESVAASDTKRSSGTVLFTLTPLEIQSP
jgi:hypothetical protein